MGFKEIIARLSMAGKAKEKLFIIDANRLKDSSKGRLPPHEQIVILKRLARFAEQEKIAIHAVLEGQPLRVAEDGSTFNGIRVYYTGKKFEANELILRRFQQKKRTRDVTVITSDPTLISGIQEAGGKVMRGSTFRKALDSKGDKISQDGGRKRNRRRKPKSPDGQAKPDKPAEKRQNSTSPDNDRVRELIDLVE